VAGKKLDTIDLLSVPLFIGTMVAEAAYLKNKPKRVLGDMYDATPDELSGTKLPPEALVPLGYERRDTTASLSMLLGNIAFAFGTASAIGKLDKFLFKHRISNIGSRRGAFVGAMVLWDFLYYWDHRWMHQIRFFWANHVAHHSGERYNLSTALRQPWSGIITAPIFAPLPLLGFRTATSMRAGQLNLLYQYWIHTEAIDRLNPLAEKVLNTPSHHRVHHGANQQYLDKNYGGILIVWDRLFGTFEPEVRRIKYGLTKNIRTYNPIRIAYHEFAEIARDVSSAKGIRHKWNYAFKHPGWQPAHA
jgi:sterol desaturase/sphingolipid hydroxylase (fatty acid hydroxylase superfamily)